MIQVQPKSCRIWTMKFHLTYAQNPKWQNTCGSSPSGMESEDMTNNRSKPLKLLNWDYKISMLLITKT